MEKKEQLVMSKAHHHQSMLTCIRTPPIAVEMAEICTILTMLWI